MQDDNTTDNKKIMMILGGFRFEIGQTGYDSLSEQWSWKWHEIERSAAHSKLMFQAKNPKVIKISGTISTTETGRNPFAKLLSDIETGKPLVLVDGIGNNHGLYVVEDLTQKSESFIVQGLPRLIKFDLSLKEYGDG